MAGPSKKPRRPDPPIKPPSSSDESMSESDSEGSLGQKVIQTDFEGCDLAGPDFHGIKQLLQQLFLKAHIDFGKITEMLIGQTGVGSVLKQGFDSDDEDAMDLADDPDVFGVTTVLNLTAHKETDCIKQLYSLFEELTVQHASKDVQEGIKNILQQSNKIGFLINERFVNISAKISVPMLTTLCDEIDVVKKENDSYDFEYLILISKTTKPKGQKDGEQMFANDEEEVFQKESEWTFDFSVEKECNSGFGGRWFPGDQELVPFRRVSVFKFNNFRKIIAKIKTLVES